MRVLQVLFPTGIGGVERIASQLLDSEFDGYIAIDEKYIDAFTTYFGVAREKIVPLDCSTFLRCWNSTRRCIKMIKPEVVHTHARKEMICVALCKKIFSHVRTQHMEENPRIPVLNAEKKLLQKRVDQWVATSNMLASTYLVSKKYIDVSKVSVIYNGAQSGQVRSLYSRRKRYCLISRLSKQKGIDLLINAVSNLEDNLKKNILIDVWGEGEELDKLINLTDELGVSNIFSFKGATKCPSKVVVNYDALLMPSRHEGLPLTMLECMSTGTPVAIHRVGCIEEFMVNERNGWIIDAKYSWKDFFNSNLDDEEYREICDSARKTYENLFALQKMKNQYFRLYESAVEKGRL